MQTFLLSNLKMLSNSKVPSPTGFVNFSSLFYLALLFDFSFSQPITQPKSIQELLNTPSFLPTVEKHDYLVAPFPQQKQQRWLSVRPFQEYRRAAHTDDLGLLLQYLDNKRNAPSLTEEDGNGRHSISGSPLGTMRFGKRTINSPLGTMRFGKREYSKSPLGTMRFG